MPLIVLSPTKTLKETFEERVMALTSTKHVFPEETDCLATVCRSLSTTDWKSLCKLSGPLAQLNYTRYQQWEELPETPAVFSFDGPSFRAMEPELLTNTDLDYAQDRLCILCGLYGVLRPLDKIRPYRLEMSTRLKVETETGEKHGNLYSFWGEKIVEELNQKLKNLPEKERFVVNVASQEYSKSVKWPMLLQNVHVWTCAFPGPAVFAKQARGAMCGFIIRERVETAGGLEKFTGVNGEWSHVSTNDKTHVIAFTRTNEKKPNNQNQEENKKKKRKLNE
eukprot:Lithocolla_globosa_v1_NODE_1863_length_2289_cov_5.724261.p1 type:complete len:280 gc:universal NODE_1863_length_2289_cov_5.724261:1695-856(-)